MAQVRKLLHVRAAVGAVFLSGKVVTNLGRDDVREIIVPPYVLMYQVNEALQRVEVMLVIHGSRDRDVNRRGLTTDLWEPESVRSRDCGSHPSQGRSRFR